MGLGLGELEGESCRVLGGARGAEGSGVWRGFGV